MKTLWLDTEFNGFGGELISAALIDEDGNFWYQSLGCKNPVPWVQQFVMPAIGIKQASLSSIQKTLLNFLSNYNEITIIADWPTDILHFCHLLSIQPYDGKIIRTPPITFVLKTHLHGKVDSQIPHNALEDARALMHYDLNLGHYLLNSKVANQ